MSWQYRRLGEVLDVQNGYAFNSKLFAANGEIGLIRIRDIRQGTDTDTRYTGEYDPKYVVHSGDFLIGMDGDFSCYEWRGKPSLLNQRVCRLQDFSEMLLPKFLFYGINKYLKEIEDTTAFTTVKHISSKQIKDILFPVPPISEQKRIGDENARIRQALDCVETNVRIADPSGRVMYANPALLKTIRSIEAEIRKHAPGFSTDTFVGSSIGRLYADPDAALKRLASLSQTARTQMVIGGRTFDVVTSPILSEAGERLGSVGEWRDRTDELLAEKEIQALDYKPNHQKKEL